LTPIHLDGKLVKSVMQKTADVVNRLSRSSSCLSLMSLVLTVEHRTFSQETNYGTTFTNGFPLRTPPRTITLRVVLIRREQQIGSFKGAFSKDGKKRIRSFGFMENLARARASSVPRLSKILKSCARPGKHRWVIFILTFAMPTSKACPTWSPPFSPNFLLAQILVLTFYPHFIWLITEARNNLVMVF